MRSSVVETGRPPKVVEPDRSASTPSQSHVSYQQAGLPSGKKIWNTSKKSQLLIPEEGWLVLLLLAVALYCVVFSVIAAKWVEQSNALLYTPIVGLLVGVGIAKVPRLPQAILHLAACLLGYWFSVFLTSVIAFHTSWVMVLGGLRATLTGNIVSLTPAVSMMVFFFYLAFLCFFLGYFGSWLIYRARLPWLVALVYCSIMLVNLNYLNVNDNHRYLLVVLLGALLLLVARMHLVNQISNWKREGLHTDQAWIHSITTRFMRIASLLTVVAMLCSVLLPVYQQSSSGKNFWNQLDFFWNNLANGRVSAAFNPGSLFPSGDAAANFFSDQLTISGNVQLPTGEVLYYKSGTSHYLQGFSYNTFDGHTWKTAPTPLQNQFYAARQMLPLEETNVPFSTITTDVTMELPPGGTKNYIFAPAHPSSFSVDTVIYSLGNIATTWTQATPLEKGKSYSVISNSLAVSPDVLAQVPLPRTNLAAWKQDQNYQQVAAVDLQLPNDLSPTVYDLAQQWTHGATDAYTTLRALESHLSDINVFTYSTDNPPIPANIDVVDYLLHNRRGYCTHYATAMIVMARTLNIPTRMVNGFSRGHYDAQRKVWAVDGSDAHSWVQAYFPSYGWVDFDPTPGYSLHTTPAAANPTPKPTPTKAVPPKTQPTPSTPHSQPTPSSNKNNQNPNQQTRNHGNPLNEMVILWLAIFVLFCAFLGFLAALATYWWRNLYANSTFVTGTYWRFCRLASWVGLAPRGWQTPYEYSYMLSQQLPEGSMPLRRLTDLFVRDRWGPPQVAPRPQEEADVLHQFWPVLRAELLRRILLWRKK